MPYYRATLRYKDGETRSVRVNAENERKARSGLEKMMRRQLADSRSGIDKSAGKPRIVSLRED